MQKTVNYQEDMPDALETNVKNLDKLQGDFEHDPDQDNKPADTKKKGALKKPTFAKPQPTTTKSVAKGVATTGEQKIYSKKAEERESRPDFYHRRPPIRRDKNNVKKLSTTALIETGDWENKQRKEAKEALNKMLPTSGYTKENVPLRPLLKKTPNVEGNVSTLKLKHENYVMVSEETNGIHDVCLMTAPTQVTMFCDANHKCSEYAGRPTVGEKPKRSAVDSIPGVPFNINPTVNAHAVEVERR